MGTKGRRRRFPSKLIVDKCNHLTPIGEPFFSSAYGFERVSCIIAKCICGSIKKYPLHNINARKLHSCGCLNREAIAKTLTKHGLCRSGNNKHPLYTRWVLIKQRCYDSNYTRYYDYGGRGIKMCDEWRNDFMAFYKWAMANGYAAGLQIDRQNNDGNYEPSNCRFVTTIVNARNKRKYGTGFYSRMKKSEKSPADKQG